jgi:hypothetical protein
MEKFLSDYGLKWVGGEGEFNREAVREELGFDGP